MVFDGFDWDAGNRRKCLKHGVSINEIEMLFRGTPWVGPDLAHSDREKRFRAVGLTRRGRYTFVVFTFRAANGALLIRPISARYMHTREVKAYEEALSRLRDGR